MGSSEEKNEQVGKSFCGNGVSENALEELSVEMGVSENALEEKLYLNENFAWPKSYKPANFLEHIPGILV